MPSDARNPQNLSPPQSIPLQDLSRPPDSRGGDGDWGGQGAFSGFRTRALLGSRRAFSGRIETQGRYERVLAGTSNDADNSRLDIPHVTTPRTAHQASPYYDDGELSPVDIGDFQAAMGGLDFGPPTSEPTAASNFSGAQLNPINENTSEHYTTLSPQSDAEIDDYFPPGADDRAPLTDTHFLQPISGSQLPDAPGQRHDRDYRRAPSYSNRLLGDDLPDRSFTVGARRSLNRVSSLSIPSITRSLSTSASPIGTAGSMLRKVSQRVVNLSSEPEPEPFERTLRRQATLDTIPSFPAMTEYAHDDLPSTPAPLEKAPPLTHVGMPRHKWQQQTNPLKGYSLGCFGPDNKLRLWLCELLVHPATEPIILLLILAQTVVLAVDAGFSIEYGNRLQGWGHWANWVLLALFILYTLELSARIIVSGFVKNADEYSTLPPGLTVRQAALAMLRNLWMPNREGGPNKVPGMGNVYVQSSILKSFNAIRRPEERGHGRQAQRIRLARRAFMRHSFNRIDLLAVMSFWISFVLSNLNVQFQRHIYVFQMLSALRILRLLMLTGGTSIILRSLKKAAPLLVNVSFLIGFFWLLFAIVGVQSFKASFRRTCVWFGDNITNVTSNNTTPDILSQSYAQNYAPGNIQFCGGHANATNHNIEGYVLDDYITTGGAAKGYICPARSLCVEGSNPYNNTVSFDNILQSLELVFVIMSSNTFSDLLYYTTDSDVLAAALYFAGALFIMSLWLMNLLVAVITSSFQVIREESKTSAFTMDDQVLTVEEEEQQPHRKSTALKRLYDKTYWLWILLIATSLVVQCVRSTNSSPSQVQAIRDTETVITLILLGEIIFRFIADWRNFHRSPRNYVDLLIAIITSVIQLPVIRNSGQPYAWLTFFQIVRAYRVVLAVPLTRNLIMVVLGNVSGLLNLIVFVFLLTFLAAIFAAQLFRGAIPPVDASGQSVRITFANIWNSFIGMYQIFSSENWTAVMYGATDVDAMWRTSWIDASFFILWFIFANFIILNMFIAVIQENFDVSEDEKRLQQVKAFLQQKELVGSTHSNLSLSTIFRLGRDKNRHRDPIDYGPATIEMFKDTVVQDFLDEQIEAMEEPLGDGDGAGGSPSKQPRPGFFPRAWDKVVELVWNREPNPFYSSLMFSRPYEDLDPRAMAREIATAAEQRKTAQREYLQKHPNYNNSIYLFRPAHPVRKFCQQVVGPARGVQRIGGVEPVRKYWYTFSAFIYVCILAMVILACITTPLYQMQYFESIGRFTNRNWFVWTDMVFAIIFTIEAIIKVIADGFFFTPNAYFRSAWGFIDGIVLVTLWISVSASLFNLGQISRGVGAVKALRALRLLNISDTARNTFYSVIIKEGWKIISAALVSLSLLIPFAIYGLNLFMGQFQSCNDSNTLSSSLLRDCVGEYANMPYTNNTNNNNWSVLSPRQVSNPYYNFDSFGSSLFILFQIVSQEGWIDVMWTAMSATGIGNQPQQNASQGNAVFFIIFNLLGAVFVLTLFVSVFMRNYTEQTGVAFLTAEQRSWLELRKLLLQISPSKRPNNRPEDRWKTWCYRIAVQKHGRWARIITVVFVLHLILLIVEWYPEPPQWEIVRDCFFLLFCLVYIANITIRLVGLGWKRFRRNSWDLYSLFAVSGTTVTTALDLALNDQQPVIRQLHKYFSVSIILMLIPRNNALDQLFKTAAASLSTIGNLIATWMVLFIVFAIALTQTLGLTRFGQAENDNLNFRTVPKALILLFRMSCGEGWNNIMSDFASINPPFCTENTIFFNSDCGSEQWAEALFILWNILSMYLFVSMFVSLIFESFSYVYQHSSGLSVVSREEIRRFKQAWATFDPDGTGYISKEAFPKLLGELSGVFEMRVYDGEHTVNQILEQCRVETRGDETPGVVQGVDIAALNRALRNINVPEIRRRRQRLNIFSQEVLVSAHPDRGVSFQSCLMILAHYKVINDSKALRLEEFLRRRYRLQRVEEEVRRRIVIGFFDTLFWSRQFRRRQELRNSARMVTIPDFAVPEIFVDDQDGPTPGPTPRVDQFPEIPQPRRTPLSVDTSAAALAPQGGLGFSSPSGPRTPDTPNARSRSSTFGTSPTYSEGGALTPTIQLHPPDHRPSDISEIDPLSLGDGQSDTRPSFDRPFGQGRPSFERTSYERRGSADKSSPSTSVTRAGSTGFQPSLSASGAGGSTARHRRQASSQSSEHMTAMEAFDNSAWGESIRRSFTLRRTGTRGRNRIRRGDEPPLPRMEE